MSSNPIDFKSSNPSPKESRPKKIILKIRINCRNLRSLFRKRF